jgi:hypothetical protein
LFRVTLRRLDLVGEVYHIREPQKLPLVMPLWATWDQRLQELGYVDGKNLVVDLLNPEQTGDIAAAVNELPRPIGARCSGDLESRLGRACT